jgi:U3 small nucleolar RNA-associated protein 18
MPRQRSKKLSASRQAEGKSSPELEVQSDSDSDNESLRVLGKDDEEEELARLVLGNGVGFKAQLSQQMDLDVDGGSEEGGDMAGEDSEGEAGLEHVDDAEVRGTAISQ